MARPNREEVSIVDGDLDDYDPEDLDNLRAYRMMPRWGQVLAWLVWELPALWYAILAGGGLWIFHADDLAWKISAVTAALLFVIAAHARKRVRNPFHYYVIVTRKPVPGAIADAAESGPERGAS